MHHSYTANYDAGFMIKTTILVSALFTIVACSNPINRHTAADYSMAAHNAQRSGDWATAKKYWGRAAINAELGGSSPQAVAILWYEYGRSSGVVCDWPEAESGLTKAYELDKASNGPAHMSLVELARMNFDRRRYDVAIGYFERVDAVVQNERLDTIDPIGYARLLDEHAISLQRVGRNSEANALRTRAVELRTANPNKETPTDRTPYGTQCAPS